MAHVEKRHDLPRQGAQIVGLSLRQTSRPGSVVDDAEGPEGLTLGRHQGRACVEPHVRLTDDQGVRAGPHVLREVWNDQQISQPDGMLADRLCDGGLAGLEAQLCLEPLPIPVDQADQGHGRVTQTSCQPDDVVEAHLRHGIQNAVVIEGRETAALRHGQLSALFSSLVGQDSNP